MFNTVAPRHSARKAVASSRLPLLVAVVALLIAAGTYFYSGGFGMKESHASEEKPKPKKVYKIGDFLLNIRADDQLRYLKVEVAATIAGYGDPGAEEGHGDGDSDDEELFGLDKQEEALARDAIVHILSDTDFEVLKTSEGRREAKDTIKLQLDEVLEGADVRKILFTSFVMQ